MQSADTLLAPSLTFIVINTMKLKHAALLVSAGALLAGCASAPRRVPVNHPIVGVWDYESNHERCSREFTTNGTCVLIGPSGNAWWVLDYFPVNESLVYLISESGDKWPHEILSDGRLLIDRGNIATKRRQNPASSLAEPK